MSGKKEQLYNIKHSTHVCSLTSNAHRLRFTFRFPHAIHNCYLYLQNCTVKYVDDLLVMLVMVKILVVGLSLMI